MSSFEDLSDLPADFAGIVRLFPLPNLVLFPHVMQPLHIFEPRYRALMEDTLAGDGLIAMAVLAPGWEKQYEDCPALFPYACLGRVATHHQLDDGTYNLLLLGVKRVRLVRELPANNLYRQAQIEVLDDALIVEAADAAEQLNRRLRQVFLQSLPLLTEIEDQVDQLLGRNVDLAVLTDVVAYMLDLPIREKVELLGERDVVCRANRVLEYLEAAVARAESTHYPPEFSAN